MKTVYIYSPILAEGARISLYESSSPAESAALWISENLVFHPCEWTWHIDLATKGQCEMLNWDNEPCAILHRVTENIFVLEPHRD